MNTPQPLKTKQQWDTVQFFHDTMKWCKIRSLHIWINRRRRKNDLQSKFINLENRKWQTKTVDYLTEDLPPVPLRTRCPVPWTATVDPHRGRPLPPSAREASSLRDNFTTIHSFVKPDQERSNERIKGNNPGNGKCSTHRRKVGDRSN